MKIGIDARIIYFKGKGQKSTIGLCVYNLLKCLLKHGKRHKYVLFFDSRISREIAEKYTKNNKQGLFSQKFENKNVSIKYFPFSQYRKFIRQAYSQFLVSAFLSKEGLDVFHACAGTMPLIYPGKAVLSLYKIEKSKSGKILQKKIIQKCKKIIVPSENFKKKLIKLYRTKEEKIYVLKACTMGKGFKHALCAEQILDIYKQVVKSSRKRKKKT